MSQGDRNRSGPVRWLGVTCGEGCRAALPIRDALVNLRTGQWTTFDVPPKCFAEASAGTSKLDSVLQLQANNKLQLSHLARGARCARHTLPCKH